MTMRLGGVWLDCKTAGRGSSTFPAPAAERPPLGGGRPVPGHPEGEGRCGEGLAQRYTGEGARSSMIPSNPPSGPRSWNSIIPLPESPESSQKEGQEFGCTNL